MHRAARPSSERGGLRQQADDQERLVRESRRRTRDARARRRARAARGRAPPRRGSTARAGRRTIRRRRGAPRRLDTRRAAGSQRRRSSSRTRSRICSRTARRRRSAAGAATCTGVDDRQIGVADELEPIERLGDERLGPVDRDPSELHLRQAGRLRQAAETKRETAAGCALRQLAPCVEAGLADPDRSG